MQGASGRRGIGQRLTPSRVELVRPHPGSDVYEAYFGCPIRYGAAADVLVLKRADLERPFGGGNPELLDMLTTTLVRRDFAHQLLSTADVGIDEVSYLLGYQDTNAFHRAFRE